MYTDEARSAIFQKARQAGAGSNDNDFEDGEIGEEDDEADDGQENPSGEGFADQSVCDADLGGSAQEQVSLPPGVKAAKDLLGSSGMSNSESRVLAA